MVFILNRNEKNEEVSSLRELPSLFFPVCDFVCARTRALIFEKKKKGTDTPSRRTRIMDAIISVAGAHGLDEECGW